MAASSQELNYNFSLNGTNVGNLGLDQDLEAENNPDYVVQYQISTKKMKIDF